MTLNRFLSVPRGVPHPALPDLQPLAAARKRIFERWPDVIVTPHEKDHERLLAQFNARLQSDDWSDLKLSHVLRVGSIAFDERYRLRADVKPIIGFFLDEADIAEQATFLNGIISIYLASYDPSADHTLRLGRAIAAKQQLINARWQHILKTFPRLWQPRNAHIDIAEAMLAQDDPWSSLKDIGLPSPHSGGLMDHAHVKFVQALMPTIAERTVVEKLFRWVRPKPGVTRQSGSTEVITAVLQPWVTRQPSDELRQTLLDNLISIYRDPRTNRGLWAGVPEAILNVIFRWLTREDMRFFTGVVDATQNSHMWPPRRDLWLRLYDEKLIDQAWVAFCDSATQYARTHLMGSSADKSQKRFGRQTARSDTSLLIMKIGSKIVVDGCHSYKTHVFDERDPNAPRLFEWNYNCDQIMRQSRMSKSHSSIPVWADWVRRTLSAYATAQTMSEPQPSATQPPANLSQPAAQTRPEPWSPRQPPAPRPTTLKPEPEPVQVLPTQRSTPGQPATGPGKAQPIAEPSQSLPTAAHFLVPREAAYFVRTLRESGQVPQNVFDAVSKVQLRHDLTGEERVLLRKAVAAFNQPTAIANLVRFLEPIFDRPLSPTDKNNWWRRARAVLEQAQKRSLISTNNRLALQKLSAGDFNLTTSETNAMEHLAQQFRAQGVELAEFISKEA